MKKQIILLIAIIFFSNLFLNAQKVGIGTTTPKNALDVEGGAVIGTSYSGTNTAPLNGLLVQGNMGIGTTNTTYSLNVKSNLGAIAGFETNQTSNYLVFSNTNGYQGYLGLYNGARDMDFGTGSGNSTGSVHLVTDASPKLTVLAAGDVGIGTTNPQNKLDIEGSMSIGSGYSGTSTAPTNGVIIQGNTGIGTTNPVAKIQVEGGGDASLSDHGFLVLGDEFSYNMVIDNNEIIARNNGAIADLYLQAHGGKVGIGTTFTPTSTLEVKPGSYSGNDGIEIHAATGNRWNLNTYSSSDNDLGFFYNGASMGYLNEAVNAGLIDFTAQHRSLPSVGTVRNFEDKVGMIVSSDGSIYNLDGSTKPQICESIPKVKLSEKAYDKSIYGVIAAIEEIDEDGKISQRKYNQGAFGSSIDRVDENDYRIIINSGGEGGIWVSNYNGNIENGDLIVSSPISGIGMKQDDDLIHSYTVAKIVMDCDFDLNSDKYECKEVTKDGKTYRMAFLACVYKCN